ncbi:conserved protein of unknown function [Xenorhabdus poinarii G6]|uniref:Cell division protein FtsH n=1 Tax=Xenorhabdus poinarii G6 TaxID=1354304 RepID=A0A068R7C5_9GAMM|nr:YqjK-like family protein [Xenorhabdus poinarii]CDG22909.1 conserved protein of unknown function [Xenorhabdus poinarii G6]
MNKSGLHQRKQRLLNKIQQQRQLLATYGQNWLEVTQPYDKGWQTLVNVKPYLAMGSAMLFLYGLRHPRTFYRGLRHMSRILGIVKVIRNTLYKN